MRGSAATYRSQLVSLTCSYQIKAEMHHNTLPYHLIRADNDSITCVDSQTGEQWQYNYSSDLKS